MLMSSADFRESLRQYKPTVFVDGERIREAAAFHGAGQPVEKGFIVLDNQDRSVGGHCCREELGHCHLRLLYGNARHKAKTVSTS